MRAGYDNNLTWYLDPNVIPHAFHHNAFLIVSNGDRARYGSITSKWEHFIFSLIHKFNQPVDEDDPYSKRDDIIVMSDEAHRTQAGRSALAGFTLEHFDHASFS